MLVKMHTMEKEKAEMQKQYKQLEDELEQRRNEIFQLKRANTAQYVLEERENWRAMVAQQKQEIEKLKKGIVSAVLSSADLEIAHQRTKSLQQQLKEDPESSESPDKVVSLISEKGEDETLSEVQETSIELGPPQPTELVEPMEPMEPVEPVEPVEPAEPERSAESVEQELCRLRAECLASQKAIEESKRVNS